MTTKLKKITKAPQLYKDIRVTSKIYLPEAIRNGLRQIARSERKTFSWAM